MSSHKTKIEQEIVRSFLENYFKSLIKDLEYIEGGEGSQAFSFSINGKEYINYILIVHNLSMNEKIVLVNRNNLRV